MSSVLILPVVSLAVAWLGALAALTHARRHGLLDLPGERRSHDAPTPRGGGVGIWLALILGIALLGASGQVPAGWATGAAGGALAVGAVGWLDDHYPLPWGVRILTHAVAAAWLLGWAGGVTALEMGFARLPLSWAGLLLPWLATVWLTNLYNFMDGIDGLAGAEGVFAGLLMAALFALGGSGGMAVAALSLAAACAGFLPWNAPSAKLFMGDVGSTSLGFVFAALALAGSRDGTMPALLALLVLGLFVYDATFTLCWRWLKGARWYTPHREHAYQYMVRAGFDHATVLLRLMAVNLLVILPVVMVIHRYPAGLGAGVVVCSLAAAWLWRTERRRRAGSPAFTVERDRAARH